MGFKDEKGKAKQDDKAPSGRVRKKRDINPDAAPAKPEKNSIYLARIKKQKELENPSESDSSADSAPYPKKKYGASDSQYPQKDKYSSRDKYPRKDNDSSKDGYAPRENKYPPKEGYKSKEGYTPRENKYPAKEGYRSKEGYTPRENKYPAKEGYRSKEGYTPRENKYPAKDIDGGSEGYAPRSKYPAKEGYKSKEGYTPKASYNSGDRAAKRRDDQDNNTDQDFENFPKKYPSKDRYPSKNEGGSSRFKSDAYPRKSDEKRPYGNKRSEFSSNRAPYAGRNAKNSDENSSLKYPRKQDNAAPYGAKKQNSFASRNASDKADNKNSSTKPDKEQDDDWEDLDKDTSHTLSYKLRNKKKSEEGDGEGSKMPLNKYLAHCGICSRREAAELVKSGVIKVNGDVVVDPGYKVQDADVVMHLDKEVIVNKGLVYILLNKPKDYITTVEDEKGRKTVMQLVEGADADRLFPVGRLDRNTTGLLLITNDGNLAQKLSHPSYKTKKIYHVTLDRPITKADFDKIIEGVTLEDGLAVVDALAHLEKKNELGLEIHSGRNRIVRRIFEHLGYVVEKLDRVVYAGLTKKNVPRGRWRYLNEKEIILLRHFK